MVNVIDTFSDSAPLAKAGKRIADGPVGILGVDTLNLQRLDDLRGREAMILVDLLDRDEAAGRWPAPVKACVARSIRRAKLAEVSSVVCWWDFPLSLIAALVRRECGLPGLSLETLLRCEHKYWSRLEQAKVLDGDTVPKFAAVDPYADPAPPLPMPFWIKPIKGTDSRMAYPIRNEEDWAHALENIQERIGSIAEGFNYFLDRAELPDEVAHVRGHWCICEEAIGGRQLTIEGWVQNGEAEVAGIVDSHCYEGTTSFHHYAYPSSLPEPVKARIVDSAERLMPALGYDASPFNIEYFWDEDTDRLSLLEINPRISQSHGRMFRLVEGAPHHQVLIDLALGRAPRLPRGEGEFPVAGKLFLRHFGDGGVVKRVPTDEEVAKLRERFGEAEVEIEVEVGDDLADLDARDSFSFELGRVHLGAKDHDALLERFEAAREMLTFEIDEG